MCLKLLLGRHLSHKWKQIRDCDYGLLWSGTQRLVWTMAVIIIILSGWKLGHPEELTHSEFHPSQRKSFWLWSRCETSETTWSVLEPYREFYEIYHILSLRTILRSWAVEAYSSYSVLRAIALILLLKSAELSSLWILLWILHWSSDMVWQRS